MISKTNTNQSIDNFDRPSEVTEGDYNADNDNRYTEVDNNILINPIENYENTIPQKNDSEAKMFSTKNVYNYKIILLGDCGVGKTSILRRYIHNSFTMSNNSTVATEFEEKNIEVDQDSVACLKIWDTMGEERYSILVKNYYKDSHGVIIVFDLCNRSSFENIKNILKDVNDNAPKDVIIFIVGNKLDLSEDRKVKDDEVKKLFNDIGYYEVSAKNGNNISLLFEQLTYKIIDKQKEEKNNDDKVIRGADGRNSIKLGDDKDSGKKFNKKLCCGKI